MATQASMILRRCAGKLIQTTSVTNCTIPCAAFHSTQIRQMNKNEKGNYTCTMIPGDGVRINDCLPFLADIFCPNHFMLACNIYIVRYVTSLLQDWQIIIYSIS